MKKAQPAAVRPHLQVMLLKALGVRPSKALREVSSGHGVILGLHVVEELKHMRGGGGGQTGISKGGEWGYKVVTSAYQTPHPIGGTDLTRKSHENECRQNALKIYLVLRDTLRSCQAYGMRCKHKGKNIMQRRHNVSAGSPAAAT